MRPPLGCSSAQPLLDPRRLDRSWRGHGDRRRWSLKTLPKLLAFARISGLRQHEVNGEVTEYPAAWPAIIDEATRAALVALLTSRRRPPASNTYPLRGVLRCALCGSNLVARPYRGRRHYQCRKDAGGCGGSSSRPTPSSGTWRRHCYRSPTPRVGQPRGGRGRTRPGRA